MKTRPKIAVSVKRQLISKVLILYIYLDLRRNPPLAYILIATVVALLTPGYFFLTLTEPMVRLIFVNSCGFLYCALATFAFGWATYRLWQQESHLFRAWLFLTLAVFMTLLAIALWFFLEVILRQPADPSTGAGFIFTANFLFWLGIYRIPVVEPTKVQLVRRVLDALVVVIGSALLLWWLWLAPVLPPTTADFATLSIVLFYPVGDFVLIVALVTLLFQEHLLQPREPLFLLGFAILLMVGADLWFSQQTATNSYQTGSLGDYLWLTALVLAGAAAALQATAMKRTTPVVQAPVMPRRPIHYFQIGLPPVMLLIIYLVMLFVHDHQQLVLYWFLTGGIAVMFILVNLRQWLMVVDNMNLTTALRAELGERQRIQLTLQHTNELLEDHVRSRTKALAAANEQLRQNEQQLRYEAFHDKLTGLPNRAYFVEQLEQALERTQSMLTAQVGVLFLDFDGFKVVNDSLGHAMGDEFLIAVARRLQATIAQAEFVARLGGDEFVILLPQVTEHDAPMDRANTIQAALRQPFEVCGHRLFASASIGVVLNDETHHCAGELLRDADIAMYRAKIAGKARSILFDATMRADATARLGLETDLRLAMLHQELYLAYQPIWHLGEQRLVGFEALVRWLHPTQGLIAPLDFIPLAEETGLILPLGAWVLEEACRQLKQWQEAWPQSATLTMSVNISARQLYQSDLPALVAAILRKVALPPTCLKLEITESAYLGDITAATTAFSGLHALGVQLQLDDFGTGYSSLSYLHRLAIDTLKIDRSFIQHMTTDERHREIVRAIVTLAHSLRLTVIAEGVETEDQLAQVTQLGCEQAQGYLFAKPLDACAAAQWLKAAVSGQFTAAHSFASTPDPESKGLLYDGRHHSGVSVNQSAAPASVQARVIA